MDLRDLTYDIQHFECTKGHMMQTGIDAIGLLPLVGMLKHGDEVGTLVKNADEIADSVKKGLYQGGQAAEELLEQINETVKLANGNLLVTDADKTGIELAKYLGEQGERAAEIKGPKKKIESLTKTASRRYPDEIDDDLKILREIKNVKKQSYTNQLRDYNLWAQDKGYTFILEVRPGAELSGPLLEEIMKGNILIKKIGE